jgi:ABC-type cobalamin/Fe3+-siderophores transport system ATPase subunit
MEALVARALVVGPLRGVDLTLTGGLTVLVGEAECGASTLLRVLAGQQPPDAGVVTGGPSRLLGLPPGADWHPTDVVVQAFGAPYLVGRRMGEMSSGERQRVRLAAVLADPAPVLLLDEPLGFLDSAGVGQVLHALKADGRAVLMVCKADARAIEQADRVVALADGHLNDLG